MQRIYFWTFHDKSYRTSPGLEPAKFSKFLKLVKEVSSNFCLYLSQYWTPTGLALMQPVIIRQMSSTAVSCLTCLDLLQTGQAYWAV